VFLRNRSWVIPLENDACSFLETVRHKQHLLWMSVIVWWICVVAFVFLANELFRNIPDSIVYAVFFGSTLLLYIPAYKLFRLRCPYCNGYAGALPLFRYRFMYCRSCGERIECCDGVRSNHPEEAGAANSK